MAALTKICNRRGRALGQRDRRRGRAEERLVLGGARGAGSTPFPVFPLPFSEWEHEKTCAPFHGRSSMTLFARGLLIGARLPPSSISSSASYSFRRKAQILKWRLTS